MKKLLIATRNHAKVSEIKQFLSDIPLELLTLDDIGILDQAPEDGRTFEENSLSKAIFYQQKSGLPSLADDGGIEIDALDGKPGVDSHRWISKTKDDDDELLIQEVMRVMRGVSIDKRGAQMRLVLTLVLPTGKVFTVQGVQRGIIAEQPDIKRTPGFPFRSVFFIPEIQKYYDHSVMTHEEIAMYNHRKKAIEQLKPIIKKHLC
ncbi:MAG: non-canonical purine NTP pyrophosphatase [Patescibacteria group bacterium]|nr:non-canonical purine NTP pyrophosphatase [Patescibacteria group bacterium]